MAEVLRQSQEDFNETENLRRQEEEEFQRAISESLKSNPGVTSNATDPASTSEDFSNRDESLRLQLEDTAESQPSAFDENMPENSGLVSRLKS